MSNRAVVRRLFSGGLGAVGLRLRPGFQFHLGRMFAAIRGTAPGLLAERTLVFHFFAFRFFT